METQPATEMTATAESTGPFMVSVGLIMLFAALITLLICKRRLARKKNLPIWIGLVGSFVASFITSLFSYEHGTWDGLASYIWNFSGCVLIFMLLTIVPSMAVVVNRRKVGMN